jgi:hypothetical protein
MPTSWTDEEFAKVSEALLYPGARVATVITGYSPAVAVAWELDARLQMLDEAGKARALQKAQAILLAEDSLLGKALSCEQLNVIRVGDIQFDPRLGIDQSGRLITRARELLSAFVDFPVNPNASGATGGGGINATCSG